MTICPFPKNFFWGASTSSHQVEGNTCNNWSEWEHSQKRMSDLQKEGKNPEDFFSGKACEHYERFREDFLLAKELGHNAHRFSIEWSRIEPEEGKFDQKAIEHYRTVLQTLRELGIEPFVTLWHWTVPLWFEHKGGWENAKSPEYFERYVEKIASELGDLVSFWGTLNEPQVYAGESFISKRWPPQKQSPWKCFLVMLRLLSGHKRAYRTIKTLFPNAQVGSVQNLLFFDETGANFLFRWKMRIRAFFWNRLFTHLSREYHDYLGINYYFREGVKKEAPVSDLGWQLFPEGLANVVREAKQFGLPMYITEHGLADAKDEKREWYIQESLKYLSEEIQNGAVVRGYLHWSFLDNFEWAEGFAPRFGLVEVDYKTQTRTPRKSALALKNFITKTP
jgi:beta-glucosidase